MAASANSGPQSRHPWSNITQLRKKPPLAFCRFVCGSPKNPKISSPTKWEFVRRDTHLLKPVMNPDQAPRPLRNHPHNNREAGKRDQFDEVGGGKMFVLSGFGYWIQGFRCFPWLALNFHMAQTLNLQPSTLQLVQYSANLPMVAKPLYGVLSDAIYFGDAHRLPYISLGVFTQVLSWGTMAAVIPFTGAFTAQMACILLSNLGASVTEVASDALVAEYGKKHKMGELQSYAFMALALGGILGNLCGGFVLELVQPKIMFIIFVVLLGFQLATSLAAKEASLYPSQPVSPVARKSVSENLREQFSDLMLAINEESISRPLSWVVASVAVVPMLSGTTFCFQTQCLSLNPSIIGISKVIGQLLVLAATICYDQYLKKVPLRKLISGVQIIYAFSVLSDWFLVKQINARLGISNELYVLCIASLAEAVAQFKLLPFSILFAKLSPPGCEGSLLAFFSSALCTSSIISGFLGVGLASLIGISSEDYSSLHKGIILQFFAALLPLGWVSCIPASDIAENGKKRSRRRKRVLSLPSETPEKSVKKL